MVREIYLEKLHQYGDKSNLGMFPKESDYDEVIDEDCNVYLPDGTLGVVFRKGAIKSLASLTPDSESYKYWKWVSRSSLTDQRWTASGKEIYTNVENRVTSGQKAFFNVATKKGITLEEALLLIKDTTPTITPYLIKKVEADGLVDVEEVKKWNLLSRKKDLTSEQLKEAIAKRNAAKLAWFDYWLRNVWENAEDKIAEANAAKKRYFSSVDRVNKAYSAVLGAITRTALIPYGRLTALTLKKWDEFQKQRTAFDEVNQLLKKHIPERWGVLNKRFSQVADERYNLWGTVFTSLTVNYNFAVARHVDGNNSKDGIAVLSALDNGTFEGFEFILHPMRLAFNLRHGDFLACDNDSTEHSITGMRNASADAESITFVWYSKDAMLALDCLECENCRKEFMAYFVENFSQYSTGEAKWNGSTSGLWSSRYWDDYKAMRAAEGDFDYTQCKNTDITGKLDTGELVAHQ